MTSGEKLGLPKDLDAAGDLVAQLRRRQQVEAAHRIGRARQADELQQQAQDLVDEQVVPIDLFSWLLAVFVLGFVALAAWWFVAGDDARQIRRLDRARSASSASIVAWLFKYFAEDSATDRFDACHHQIETMLDQIDEAEEEQEELDRELPLTRRLGRAAIAACRAAPGRAGTHAAGRKPAPRSWPGNRRRPNAALKLAEEKYAVGAGQLESQASRAGPAGRHQPGQPGHDGRPVRAAGRAGSPDRKSPRRHAPPPARVRHRLAADRRARRKETSASRRRRKPTPLEQLDQLDHCGRIPQAQQRVAQRQSIRERAKALRTDAVKHAHAAIGFRRRREALFQKCGVADETGAAPTGGQARRSRGAAQEAGRDHARNRRRHRQARQRSRFRAAPGRRPDRPAGARLGNALHAIGRARPRA